MLSRADHQAADISAPVEGSIFVLAITTAASAEQDFTSSSYFNNGTIAPQFITMKCSVRWYITFKDVTGVTNPDETQTSGNGRTWEVAPDEPFCVRIGANSASAGGAAGTLDLRRFFKVKGSASANLRFYASSANDQKGA